MLTQNELKERLHYSVITGLFYWLKSSRNHVKIGDVAGSFYLNRYSYIGINKKQYLIHRLAWFYVTGKWPKFEIDHKNGMKHDNYWLNLREATRLQNLHNQGISKTNTSGFKGVYWHKANEKWIAMISVNNKGKYLGSYTTPELAYEAYCISAKKIRGDFAGI